jgi:hypothetical protein
MSGSSTDTIIAGVTQRVASRRAGLLAFADILPIAHAGPMFGRAGLTESHVCWGRKGADFALVSEARVHRNSATSVSRHSVVTIDLHRPRTQSAPSDARQLPFFSLNFIDL